MKKQKLTAVAWASAWFAALVLLFSLARMSETVSVSTERGSATIDVRLVDVDTGKATTAMICLRNLDDEKVRLPPDGRVLTEVGRTKEFYKGISYDGKDPAWIGPIRKTMGKGDNNDRAYVYELRPSIPYWREPVMYQTESQFKVDLPPGRYRLSVSHGMEFVPVADNFTVVSGKNQKRTVRLKRWVNLAARGWYSGDVHVHHPTLEKSQQDFLLHYAEAEDLHVVNVLEMGHHKGTDFKQGDFGKASRVHRGGHHLVAGQEEPRSRFGHIIGLNLSALARDLPTYDLYDLAFDRIHDQEGALVGFAHFSWNGCSLPRGFPWIVTTGEIDFLELLQFNILNAEDYYDYLNLGFRFAAAAGSDAPWGSTIGEVRTYVYTGDTLNVDTWFENLGRGHTFVSNGPALEFAVDEQLPGSELKRKAGDTLAIRAKAWGHPKVGQPDTLALVSNEGVVQEVKRTAGDEGPLELDLKVPVERSQWWVVSAHCANGAMAHATPVYVVVDEQPTWCVVNGPRLVREKLGELAAIEKEVETYTDELVRGVPERIAKAKLYYGELLDRIVASQRR